MCTILFQIDSFSPILSLFAFFSFLLSPLCPISFSLSPLSLPSSHTSLSFLSSLSLCSPLFPLSLFPLLSLFSLFFLFLSVALSLIPPPLYSYFYFYLYRSACIYIPIPLVSLYGKVQQLAVTITLKVILLPKYHHIKIMAIYLDVTPEKTSIPHQPFRIKTNWIALVPRRTNRCATVAT